MGDAPEVATNSDRSATITDPIDLEKPIDRGGEKITKLQLRRPGSGELRGISMVDLVKLEYDTLRVLLPRITVPNILAEEVDKLDPADTFALATEVANFLLPKAARLGFPTA